MGAKIRNRIIASLIAVVLIAVSGVGVFAAGANDSPKGGRISGGDAYATSKTAGGADWTAADNAAYYRIYVNGAVVIPKTTSTHADLSLAKNSHFIVAVQAVYSNGKTSEITELGRLCTYREAKKVKAKRAGKRAIKVSWKKNTKGIKHYKIVVYENGKYKTTYTVGNKKTSKKIKKLTKGAKYTFTVYPVCTSHFYKGIQKTTKSVTAK